MTVRDVRLHWPKAEKALAEGEEILITRDSKPVARLLPLVPGAGQKRQRFDPIAHARQMQRFFWIGAKDSHPKNSASRLREPSGVENPIRETGRERP